MGATYQTSKTSGGGTLVTHLPSKTILGIFLDDHTAENFIHHHRDSETKRRELAAEHDRLRDRNEQLRRNLEHHHKRVAEARHAKRPK